MQWILDHSINPLILAIRTVLDWYNKIPFLPNISTAGLNPITLGGGSSSISITNNVSGGSIAYDEESLARGISRNIMGDLRSSGIE